MAYRSAVLLMAVAAFWMRSLKMSFARRADSCRRPAASLVPTAVNAAMADRMNDPKDGGRAGGCRGGGASLGLEREEGGGWHALNDRGPCLSSETDRNQQARGNGILANLSPTKPSTGAHQGPPLTHPAHPAGAEPSPGVALL